MSGIETSFEADAMIPERQEISNGWMAVEFGIYRIMVSIIIENLTRVAFDCSAVFEGQSLNQNLLLIISLLGIFCRFRQGNTAFMYVPPSHGECQRSKFPLFPLVKKWCFGQ